MQYQAGDLVFAKVKGFPAWPAKITNTEAPGGKEKFSVVFFGTQEFANLWTYLES